MAIGAIQGEKDGFPKMLIVMVAGASVAAAAATASFFGIPIYM